MDETKKLKGILAQRDPPFVPAAPAPHARRRNALDPKTQGRTFVANAQRCADAGDIDGAERRAKLAERVVATTAKLETLQEAERADDIDELRAELRARLEQYGRAESLHERLEWPAYWQKLVFEWEGEEPPWDWPPFEP
jgi:hypothetical protein